jgi:NAD(P)-dependent dehydrogenase (short-subunit alcohol dehydrogenase family)
LTNLFLGKRKYKMKDRLKNKVALITGGGSGIGRAVALACAGEGAKVVIAYNMNEKGARETVERITKSGGKALAVKADVTKAVQVETLIKKTVETYGRLDCACNNAGIEGPNILTGQYPEEDWDRVFNVNIKGAFLCMRYEIPQMLIQKRGVIVNNSSGLAFKNVPYLSAYTATKHAIIGLTKTAALEYAKEGIRINAVCPGIIRVGLGERMIARGPEVEEQLRSIIPMGRFGEAEEVAEGVVWLFSDAASYVTGHALLVDGAVTIT